jgi:hypothetical protein
MNVQDALTYAGRLIEDVHRQTRDYLADGSETDEPTAGALWVKASPDLDKALAVYDKMESPNTPESTWNPFAESKATCKEDLDKILDALLLVLGACGAVGYRKQIKSLQTKIAVAKDRIVSYREQREAAPTESSQNFIGGLLAPSREALVDRIADENDCIAEKSRQIESLKVGFRKHLQQIGIIVSPETADSFLLPVHNEIVSMAAVISNIGHVTELLQRLVDESRETPSHTKRYYGVYVLMVLAVDRIQQHFVREIDENFIPKLGRREQEATRIIAHAQAEISRGGNKELLSGNIGANRKIIHACQLMTEILRSHRGAVLDENNKVKILVGSAVNAYRTVRLSFDVAELIGSCDAAFQALRALQLPPLRAFKNVHLNEELQKLAEQMVDKE